PCCIFTTSSTPKDSLADWAAFLIPFVFADGAAAGSVAEGGWAGLTAASLEGVLGLAGSPCATMNSIAKVMRASVTQKVEGRFFILHSVQFSSVSVTLWTTPETAISYALLRGNASTPPEALGGESKSTYRFTPVPMPFAPPDLSCRE